ncbi:MAG: hypothetical protein A2286_00275 [Gammaproteobacteria bacterium RIFOXYA12_FULL_61_12]|nr:MAG: hypothetical protein A2514_11255 [Gammaproteobacteria bacterium RIFOXYD12_FULL_61_37]OGT94027.1 MAG: hypothetical protein A2286_00275 [Gammaproteobacteria bacterium RIFOXYA12_FULL_61_12]
MLNRITNAISVQSALGLLLTLFVLAMPEIAFAMPWDTPLRNFTDNLTGTVATSVAAIVFVVAGLLIAFGEVNGILGTVLRIALGLSFALMATSWIGIFSGSGGR